MKNQLFNKFATEMLHKRFLDLWQRCLSPSYSGDGNVVFQDLFARYNTPDRYYHDLNHLLHCLGQLDLAAYLIPQADTVELALWFHDAVYEPGSPENERHSAELFRSRTADAFAEEFKQAVEQLILITAHKDVPRNEGECFIVDIDLSSFGSDWVDFLEDTGNLRKERNDISDPVYFQAHTQFLKLLLARKRIFYTDFFYMRYEHIALQNISRLLNKRKSLGYL